MRLLVNAYKGVFITVCLLGLRLLVLLTSVLSISFLLFAALPSDPVRSTLGMNASEDAVRAIEEELGYNRNILDRYFWHMRKAIFCDFGQSLQTRRPVILELLPATACTLKYVTFALTLSVVSSIFLVSIAYFSPPVVTVAIFAAVSTLTSMPSLVVAMVVGIVAIGFGLFRFALGIEWESFIAASISLSIYPICSLSEIGITEIRRAEQLSYVMTSRAFGMTKLSILRFYLFRTVLVTWLGHLSNLAASLFVGSSVIEVAFSLPGLGQVLVSSIAASDFPMLQGILVVVVMLFFGLNTLFDVVLLSRLAGGKGLLS